MTDSTPFSSRKQILFVVVLTLLPLIGLGAIEGALRLTLRVKYGAAGKSYGLWRADKELGAIQLENGYNTHGLTNNYGFRNDEDVFDPKPKGALRIITVGGSSTYCYNLLQHETWPYRLEQLLRKLRPGGERDQVLNAGGVMWSIGQVFARAKRDIPALKPDYVLIYSGINEEGNDAYLRLTGNGIESSVKAGRYGVFATNLDQDNWVARNIVLYKALAKYVVVPIHDLRFQKVAASTDSAIPSEPDPFLLKNYLVVLRQLISLIQENGAKPVFIIEITGSPSNQNVRLTSYSRAGAHLASEMGVTVVDPSPILSAARDPTQLFLHTGVHYSIAGAERFAGYVFRAVFARMPAQARR